MGVGESIGLFRFKKVLYNKESRALKLCFLVEYDMRKCYMAATVTSTGVVLASVLTGAVTATAGSAITTVDSSVVAIGSGSCANRGAEFLFFVDACGYAYRHSLVTTVIAFNAVVIIESTTYSAMGVISLPEIPSTYWQALAI